MEVSYHITELCNLNCNSCWHFIPISTIKDHYTFDKIMYEMDLLSKHENIINRFNIMGGEPLIHPDIIPIIYYVRKSLPNTKIGISTNGVNHAIFENKRFIEALKHNNIEIRITQYPYNDKTSVDNYYRIYEILNENNIKYEIVSIIDKNYKFLIQPFRKNITNDINLNKWCKTFHYCTMYRDNKLWICHVAAYVDFIQRRFPDADWIKSDENSFIDISKECTDEEILNSMSKLALVCEHCVELHRGWNSNDPSEITNWKPSTCSKDEWIRE